MRYGLPAVVLIGAATLGGCTEGVLDPKGPIALAERQILLNSLGIMLAIVIPTILATLCRGCDEPKLCKLDLAHNPNGVAWEDYCPNAVVLNAMAALRWFRPKPE